MSSDLKNFQETPRLLPPQNKQFDIHKLWAVCALLAATQPLRAADKPTPQQTNIAFDQYVAQAEACMQRADSAPTQDRNLHIAPVTLAAPCQNVKVPDATVQDWRGTMFIPGVTIDDFKKVLQDYPDYKKVYPDVNESREISRHGNEFDVFLRLTQNIVVMTVALNTTNHVLYETPNTNSLNVTSRSTRIAEVKDPKKSLTEEKPEGEDHGFLRRINTYWGLRAADGGVYVRCEAISLSRSIPGVIYAFKGFIDKFPKDSLQKTMLETQAAVLARHAQAVSGSKGEAPEKPSLAPQAQPTGPSQL